MLVTCAEKWYVTQEHFKIAIQYAVQKNPGKDILRKWLNIYNQSLIRVGMVYDFLEIYSYVMPVLVGEDDPSMAEEAAQDQKESEGKYVSSNSFEVFQPQKLGADSHFESLLEKDDFIKLKCMLKKRGGSFSGKEKEDSEEEENLLLALTARLMPFLTSIG